MTPLLRAPGRPDRTIRATVATGPIPNGSHRVNDPRCGSGAARLVATPHGWVVPKIFRVGARPTSPPKASSIHARQNRKALFVTSAIAWKFAPHGFLQARALFSRTARAARQKHRATPVAPA